MGFILTKNRIILTFSTIFLTCMLLLCILSSLYLHSFFNGVRLDDPLTGLRVVRWDVIKSWKPKSKGFGIEVELNHFIKKNGFNIIEIPIDYRKRIGEKKLGIRHGLIILKRILLQV